MAIFSRREFGTLTGGAFASLVLGPACGLAGSIGVANDGRIGARPRADVKTTARGHSALGLESGRDGVLHMPPKETDAAMPLLVLLHGAGSAGERVLQKFIAATDAAGIAVLSPDSRGQTWDAIRGGFSSDVTFISRALSSVFDRVLVDPARLAVGGFSDGATYALALGLINGDLFRRVICCSPGFLIDGEAHGKPQFFVSHGTSDTILPINQCGRVVVANLRKRGYDVTFREFEGEHEVPPAVAKEAMEWAAR